jgi:hypothetical protein
MLYIATMKQVGLGRRAAKRWLGVLALAGGFAAGGTGCGGNTDENGKPGIPVRPVASGGVGGHGDGAGGTRSDVEPGAGRIGSGGTEASAGGAAGG